MDTPIHPNLTHLATLSHRARQRSEARISWAYISDTPAAVVCGLCGEHEHMCADTRFWRCPMAACGHSVWHDSCLDGMFEREAVAGRALAFGCPACGTGWWLRSEMSAEGAQLREAWQEMQMLMLLQGVEEMEGWSGPGSQQGGLEEGVQQQQQQQQLALEQERHLSHLHQEYKLKKQQRQQQALAEEGHLRQAYQQYLLKEQQALEQRGLEQQGIEEQQQDHLHQSHQQYQQKQQQQQGSEQQHHTHQLYQQYQQGLEQQDIERQYHTHQLYHLKQQQQQQLQQSFIPLLQPESSGEDT
ncbi:hypothetical protein ASPACDRAFT_41581 [Aspergillus aculeatus ATCC 16872]|uniref:RING-type domain-containing protein n=1 Tax=Aspergillus aculeatus (strain ATCC 16872 / CBS 172.66 / WB 5094) TaxID=690307 RepID=A0A1L9WYP0_ASPA1|nr:uncharacterized protein ASPACDRAFT_41581 [Aspergillus aculeatus ATCC 16872]OJK01321.1 hypothetical protein ASPACDRAFT_41581 [Aspergillus aculeatus ATCC 16872]